MQSHALLCMKTNGRAPYCYFQGCVLKYQKLQDADGSGTILKTTSYFHLPSFWKENTLGLQLNGELAI